jgi:DnaK suppressor protein
MIMNKKDLEYFKDLIIKKKNDLLAELGYLESSSMSATSKDQSGDLSSYSFHMADQGTDTMEREMAFTFASREGRYLHHLNEALERIESGTYGKCRTCGGEISKPRLEAVPHATQCIKCKNSEEKKQRGM